MDPAARIHIPAQSGAALVLKQGQSMRVIDVEGEQVSDLLCFAQDDTQEVLSAGHTTDYNEKLFLSTGDVLYSNRSNPMLTIQHDDVGRHPLLYAPCSQAMFEHSYGAKEPHPNCHDNLLEGLAQYGITSSQISIPLNIFMNVTISEAGHINIKPPRSKVRDYIELRAEMDLIVAITACSAGACNNFHCTPIDVEIFEEA
ncbi:MAG: urea carboxylase-associated family protein [Chloroflexi bacterium]|nr:MAG: urea carboxylase-associated family protein [Chloroflexota bacterium]MBL1195312.1 urea carboxylase-associated family protein [Chloroflexota bacterium]NOH12596.1 urea carboxylase-associated family protein [Chloroflexota bacterium]